MFPMRIVNLFKQGRYHIYYIECDWLSASYRLRAKVQED